MNFKQLEYFVEVYNCKSYKKAADQLMITPQGVYKMVKSLEDDLGKTLFVREKNSIYSTPDADELYLHARNILEEALKIRSPFQYNKRRISIFGIDSIMSYYLKDFIIYFYKKYPDVTIKFTETSNKDAISHLIKKECDFALLQKEFESSEIHNHFLFIVPFVVVAHKDHSIAKFDSVDDEIFNHINIAGRGFDYVVYADTIKYFNKKGIYPTTVFETNNNQLLMNMVQNNLAVAIVNEMVAHYYKTDELKIVKINDAKVFDRVSLSWHKEISPEADIFRHELINWIKENPQIFHSESTTPQI